MNFHEYLYFKCINITELGLRLNIGRKRLASPKAPYNLTYVEVARIKEFIGDWDTYEKPSWIKDVKEKE